MVKDKAVATQERSEARTNLLINSALLNLIDPVRGLPTKSPLEGNPDEDVLRSHQLRWKFLDSFALVSSTSSSGKVTASAVCLEPNQPSGTVLRVARNRGLSQQDLDGLKRLLQILVAVANGEKLSMQAETEVLEEVVDLDKSRILSLVGKLEKGEIRYKFQLAISKLSGNHQNRKILEEAGFEQWIKACPFMATSLRSSGPSQLFSLVKWASQARWVYPKQLQDLLGLSPTSNPPWIETLYKLARYWGAIKSMVKFAVKQPQVFANIHIQGVEPPAQQKFPSDLEKAPIREALSRLTKKAFETTSDKSGERWRTDDVEGKLRNACNLTLTLHAEMQLLDFYERNPALVPQPRLMGTSKKACYLCYQFLLRHPLQFQVSACHQKVYPTWMPPSSRDIPGVPRNKLFWNFTKDIEKETVEALRTGLVASQRLMNKDSTAGPSLTVTATVPTEVLLRHIARQHLPFNGEIMSGGGTRTMLAGP